MILVLGLGDTFKSPEIIEMRVLGFPISKSKSYKPTLKQHNIMELLSTVVLAQA